MNTTLVLSENNLAIICVHMNKNSQMSYFNRAKLLWLEFRSRNTTVDIMFWVKMCNQQYQLSQDFFLC